MELLAIQGKTIKICKNSITCKNENGKTCGVVTGFIKFKDLQANKQIIFTKALRTCGLWGSKFNLMENVIFYDNKLFNIVSIGKLEHYKKFYPEKYMELANIIKVAEENNIYTLFCYM